MATPALPDAPNIAASAAPPTLITSMHFAGVSLEQWVLIGNAVYIVLAIGILIYRTFWRKNVKQ